MDQRGALSPPSTWRWAPRRWMWRRCWRAFPPDIFLVIGPFTTVTSCLVHANLNWTFGPLRYVFVSPVFHRWHHAADVVDTNFASTFSLWDWMFGTYYMPAGRLPTRYGIDDAAMPEGLMPQLVYPLLQKA